MGGSATGEIERPHDQDWFAVTLEAGKWYRIDLEGSPTGRRDPDRPVPPTASTTRSGNYIRGTYDNNWGVGRNSRVFFEAENAGTHYIAADAIGAEMGTYRVSVAEVADDHPARDRHHRDGRGGGARPRGKSIARATRTGSRSRSKRGSGTG